MVHKRLLGLAVMLLLLAFPVSAFTVSILVVETGLSEEASSAPHTALWESGIMDALFDAGHIVTNSPAARMAVRPAQDFGGFLEEDYNEAVSGGAEFFILCFLNYQKGSGSLVPVSVSLKLYKTDSKKLVFEQDFQPGSGRNRNEEYQIAKRAGNIIISQLRDR